MANLVKTTFYFAVIVFFAITLSVSGNDIVNKQSTYNDTIAVLDFDPVIILPEKKEFTKRELKKYNRLVINVKKVYPYAIIAKKRLIEINDQLLLIPNEIERKEYLDIAEKQLMSEFENDLKKLTITQGKILIKLINRETGETTYTLVKELRSTWTALFWQSVGRIFGYNLKTEYQPILNPEDREIENIILQMQWGIL